MSSIQELHLTYLHIRQVDVCVMKLYFNIAQRAKTVLSLPKLHDWKLSDRAGARRTAAGFQISNTRGQAVT